MKKPKKSKRVTKYTAVRLEIGLHNRVEAVAVKQHSNVRIVIEQCVDNYLPTLEKQVGIACGNKASQEETLSELHTRSSDRSRKASNG